MSPSGTASAGVEVGTVLPPLTLHLTRSDLSRYAQASGDDNPIHASDDAARRLRLPGVVAHGMLTLGGALRIVTDWVGDPARVRSAFARFAKPVVVPDDTAGAEVLVTASVVALDGDLATVALEAVCEGQKVLSAARVEVVLGD